jgi:hypothetical protein
MTTVTSAITSVELELSGQKPLSGGISGERERVHVQCMVCIIHFTFDYMHNYYNNMQALDPLHGPSDSASYMESLLCDQ